jgi:hypothetical protein
MYGVIQTTEKSNSFDRWVTGDRGFDIVKAG